MNFKITNDVSKLKEEIEEYKFIHYRKDYYRNISLNFIGFIMNI